MKHARKWLACLLAGALALAVLAGCSALRSYAAGRTQMGAVFIEYGGETYVVAMFA